MNYFIIKIKLFCFSLLQGDAGVIKSGQTDKVRMKVEGWNEALMVYILAAASPTHSIEKKVDAKGWARNGDIKNGRTFYRQKLPLGEDFGGPLFFAHYSFIGLDPRELRDEYASSRVPGLQFRKLGAYGK